ncbi:MAG: hypothetical protein F6K41_32210 [Symploca sp. SIO3E6]|nr:hypothetical protein [Caldora sp. SIO3E6]
MINQIHCHSNFSLRIFYQEIQKSEVRSTYNSQFPIPNSQFPIPNSQTTNNKQQTTIL